MLCQELSKEGFLEEVFAASLGPEAIMIAPGCPGTRVRGTRNR